MAQDTQIALIATPCSRKSVQMEKQSQMKFFKSACNMIWFLVYFC